MQGKDHLAEAQSALRASILGFRLACIQLRALVAVILYPPETSCPIGKQAALAASALQQWLKLLEGDSANWCVHLRIRSALDATLLWKDKTHGATNNPSKFDIRFGQSRQNDIDHISMFAPYVDALTTDRDMRNLCRNKVVADELKRLPCKLFSKNSYDELETWLDSLLAAPNKLCSD